MRSMRLCHVCRASAAAIAPSDARIMAHHLSHRVQRKSEGSLKLVRLIVILYGCWLERMRCWRGSNVSKPNRK